MSETKTEAAGAHCLACQLQDDVHRAVVRFTDAAHAAGYLMPAASAVVLDLLARELAFQEAISIASADDKVVMKRMADNAIEDGRKAGQASAAKAIEAVIGALSAGAGAARH